MSTLRAGDGFKLRWKSAARGRRRVLFGRWRSNYGKASGLRYLRLAVMLIA